VQDSIVIYYHSLCFRVTVLELGVYCAIGAVLGRPFLNLMRFYRALAEFRNF
jgi:hypothetical protein